jgi:hypothetical protein
MARKLPCSRQILAVTALVAGVGIATTSAASGAVPSIYGSPAHLSVRVGVENPGDHRYLSPVVLERLRPVASAAVHGATFVSADRDDSGDGFVVHMKRSNGSEVTVLLNASFVVTGVEAGAGGVTRSPKDAVATGTV